MRVAAFDGAVELRSFGRQFVKSYALLGRRLFRSRPLNALPPSIWMALTGKGMSAMALSRKVAAALDVARRKVFATVHVATGQ